MQLMLRMLAMGRECAVGISYKSPTQVWKTACEQFDIWPTVGHPLFMPQFFTVVVVRRDEV